MRYLTKNKYYLEEAENEGTWAISYGDMITLLLSFFVIFFTTDLKKEKSAGLNDYMSFSMEELKQIPGDLYKIGNKSDIKINHKDLQGLDIKLHQSHDRIIVSFGRFSFFKSGQTDLRREGDEVLKQFVEKFLPYAGSYRLSIKGFTDKTKVSALKNRRYKDNLELSALRSISAMRTMQKAGIPLNRMEIAGAGELHLIQEILPDLQNASENDKNNFSRTIMIVISPEKESWL